LNGGELISFENDPKETRTEALNEKNLPTVYEQICKNYQAIDDFHAKLLLCCHSPPARKAQENQDQFAKII
jgi:hypothetical protein